MPVRLIILQEIWRYSGMEPFWCIQCCNRTRCNLQTLLCVEKAMLVAFQLLFMVKISCGTFTHDNKSEKIYSKQPNPLKDLTPGLHVLWRWSTYVHWIQPFWTIEYSNLLCNMCPKFGSVPSLWISKDKLPHFWSNSKLFSHYYGVTDDNVKLNQFLKMFLTAMTLNCAWNCQFARDPQEGNSSKRLKM